MGEPLKKSLNQSLWSVESFYGHFSWRTFEIQAFRS